MTSLLADTRLDAEQQDFVRTIRSSGESLLGVINDILDFSKLESGAIAFEHIPLDVATLGEEVLELFAVEADRKRLNLVLDYDPGFPAHRLGDPTRVRQILVNLVGNALKFTTEGEIVLSIRPSGEAGERLRLAVRDTGMGIAPDKQRVLFQPFSQVDASTTRKYGGTGLGLAISRQLAERMGGSIACESKAGEGTTFHVELPLPPDATAPPADGTGDRLRGKRVLLIESRPTSRTMHTRVLEDRGLIVFPCPDGAAALARLATGPACDFAVIDPDALGRELSLWLETATGLSAATPMRLVLLLAPGRSASRLRANERAHAAVSKPVRRRMLLDTLDGLASGHAHRDETRTSGRLAPITPLAGAKQLRVLLVEDNVVNQKLALLMLQRLGVRADLAGNGFEAIEALHRQPYDLVLMDVQMPELDGLEATRRIRQSFPAAAQPRIIALTAGVAQFDEKLCRAAGMDGFLAKPFKTEGLASILDLWRPPHHDSDLQLPLARPD